MAPLAYYYQLIQDKKIVADAKQVEVLERLQVIYQQLISEHKQRNSWLNFIRKNKLVKGFYLWGSVGVGKTFVMDCFYECLPFKTKRRVHFYQFMRQIHQGLKQHQGQIDPLKKIAQRLAEEVEVICFDEFFVSDITDAMILARLLQALFSYGVCLIITSNAHPDDLYKNGLQRSQFLPAIELIKNKLEVFQILSQSDYRLRHLQMAGVFYTPLNKTAAENMEKSFNAFGHGRAHDNLALEINNRSIPIVKKTDRVIWFDFAVICKVPRSQQDYLAIAENFKTVLISNVAEIQAKEKDTISLFIAMVDVFYDARVQLVLSSAVPLAHIYKQGSKSTDYLRTYSRLQEMQSSDYFNPRFI